MSTQKTIAMFAVLCLIALGVGYWVGQLREGSGGVKPPPAPEPPEEPDFLKKGLVAYFPFDEDFDDKVGGYSPKKPLVFVKGRAGVLIDGAVGKAWNVALNPLSKASHPTLTNDQIILTPFNVSFIAKTARVQTASPATLDTTSFTTDIHNSVIFPYITNQGGGGVGVTIGKNNISIYAHRGNYFGKPLSYDTDFTGYEFHHYSLNFMPDGKIILFLDSKQVHTAPGQTGYSFKPVDIGGAAEYSWPGNDKNRYEGVIDELRIYNRALSKAEVKALYDFKKPKGK